MFLDDAFSHQPQRIIGRLYSIERKLDRIMSQLDDLNAALAQEGTDVSALQAAVSAIEAKLANVPGAPDLSAEIAQVNKFNAALEGMTASTNPAPATNPATNPAPTVAPAPVPSVNPSAPTP